MEGDTGLPLASTVHHYASESGPPTTHKHIKIIKAMETDFFQYTWRGEERAKSLVEGNVKSDAESKSEGIANRRVRGVKSRQQSQAAVEASGQQSGDARQCLLRASPAPLFVL